MISLFFPRQDTLKGKFHHNLPSPYLASSESVVWKMIHPLNYPSVHPSPAYVFSGQSIILWASPLAGCWRYSETTQQTPFFMGLPFRDRIMESLNSFNLITSLKGLPHWLSCKDFENPNPDTVSVMYWTVSLQNLNVKGIPWGSNG